MAIATAVGAAAKAAIEALGLTGLTVVVRKSPTLAAADTPPLAIVTVGEEGTPDLLWAGKVLATYPVSVALVTAGGNRLADDATLRAWRQAVRRALGDPASFAGVTGFNECRQSGGRPFDAAGLKDGWTVSVVGCDVEVLEPRS